MTAPRGIRNANPGNIRHSRTLWQGEAEVQPDADFVTFRAPEWGLRAIAKILLTYQRNGLNTVRKIVHRWAPPMENDTAAYVASVAARIGVDADVPIDLHNAGIMGRLVRAIVQHENGRQPYSDAIVGKALELAGLGPPTGHAA